MPNQRMPRVTLSAETMKTLRRIFKAFHYRDFRLMWIGACTSSIGTWMQIVAQGWLIYRLSHSAFLLALDQFLGGIPIFMFSLIGGVIADRVERRKILLASQYVQMFSAAVLTILVATGSRTRLAHSLSFFHLRLRPGLRRTSLFGADSHAGRKRRHAECHRPEFDPVQRGGHGRASTGRAGLGEAGRKMVLRPERAVLPRSHRVPVHDHRPFSAGENHGVHVHQPEAGHSIRSQAERPWKR